MGNNKQEETITINIPFSDWEKYRAWKQEKYYVISHYKSTCCSGKFYEIKTVDYNNFIDELKKDIISLNVEIAKMQEQIQKPKKWYQFWK